MWIAPLVVLAVIADGILLPSVQGNPPASIGENAVENGLRDGISIFVFAFTFATFDVFIRPKKTSTELP